MSFRVVDVPWPHQLHLHSTEDLLARRGNGEILGLTEKELERSFYLTKKVRKLRN